MGEKGVCDECGKICDNLLVTEELGNLCKDCGRKYVYAATATIQGWIDQERLRSSNIKLAVAVITLAAAVVILVAAVILKG